MLQDNDPDEQPRRSKQEIHAQATSIKSWHCDHVASIEAERIRLYVLKQATRAGSATVQVREVHQLAIECNTYLRK